MIRKQVPIILEPPLFEKAIIVYDVSRFHIGDEDNTWGGIVKVTNDALKNTGLLKDDSRKFVKTVVHHHDLTHTVRGWVARKAEREEKETVVVTVYSPPDADTFQDFLVHFKRWRKGHGRTNRC